MKSMMFLLLLAGCHSKPEINYCDYAFKNTSYPDYGLKSVGEKVKNCVSEIKEERKEEALGVTTYLYIAELKLDLEFERDMCNSEQAVYCLFSGQKCLADHKRGNKRDDTNWDKCIYPDAVVMIKKGESRSMIRKVAIEYDPENKKTNVRTNTFVKKL